MKKKNFVLIFLGIQIFIATISHAENQHKIDSLENVLHHYTLRDTTYVKTLKSYAYLFQFSDPEKYKKNILEALQLADSLHFEKGVIQCDYALALIVSEHGEKKEAIKLFEKCLAVSVKANDTVFIASSYGGLARSYYELGNSDSSISYYERAIKIFDDLKRYNDEAVQLNGLAVVYEFKGNLEKALTSFQKAEKLFSADEKTLKGENKFTSYLVDVYLNITELLNNFGNLKSAMEYAQKANVIAEKNNYKRESAFANFVLGSIEIVSRKEYGNGIIYCRKSLNLFEEIESKDRIAMVCNLMGQAFVKLAMADSAEFYCRKGLQFSEEVGFVQEITNALKGIGMAKNLKKDYDSAIEYYLKALVKSKESNDNLGKKEILESLAETYSNKGNYNKAYETLKSFTLLKDSILDAEKQKSINELTTKYETEKKEKEITVLTKDKEIQRLEIKKQKLLKNSFIGGLALLSILSFLAYRTYRTRQKLKLQLLRNKIASDLHDDVGSTLSSIAIFSEVAQQQSKEVIPMLDTIGDSARKMLDAMADIVWTINPENDQFEKIILRMRSFAYELLGAKKIDFEFIANDDVTKMKLPMDMRKNLYLIFKEATNNMVKYSDASKASFSISGTKEKLTMMIRDNGKGFDMTKLSEGNGLKNMKRRAEEIGAQLLIESFPGSGTTIQLSIMNV